MPTPKPARLAIARERALLVGPLLLTFFDSFSGEAEALTLPPTKRYGQMNPEVTNSLQAPSPVQLEFLIASFLIFVALFDAN